MALAQEAAKLAADVRSLISDPFEPQVRSALERLRGAEDEVVVAALRRLSPSSALVRLIRPFAAAVGRHVRMGAAGSVELRCLYGLCASTESALIAHDTVLGVLGPCPSSDGDAVAAHALAWSSYLEHRPSPRRLLDMPGHVADRVFETASKRKAFPVILSGLADEMYGPGIIGCAVFARGFNGTLDQLCRTIAPATRAHDGVDLSSLWERCGRAPGAADALVAKLLATPPATLQIAVVVLGDGFEGDAEDLLDAAAAIAD